ncbi:MAG: TVP38/TMEM64 family protein [Alphaproteobacteria bacterium]|nr:TVP38/TMEM64 family protein [Alphaproteobacteria bacterium]
MSETDPRPAQGGRSAIRRLVPIAILVAGLAAFFALGLDRYVSLSALRDHREALTGFVAANGAAAGLSYVGLYALAVALSIPGGTILTVTGGFLFGPYLGATYAVLGATLGATLLFLAAHYAFAETLRARFGSVIGRMQAGFAANAFSYMLVLRLVPLFPFWLVNLVPALLNVRLATYALGTLLGIIPGTFVFALVGDGLGAVLDAGGTLDASIILEWRFIGPILGLALLALVPVVYKQVKRR